MSHRAHKDHAASADKDHLDSTAQNVQGAPAQPENAPEGPEPELSEPAAALQQELAMLRARVQELEKQLERERHLHLRALADFQNYKRRADEQRSEIVQFANREMMLGLLPILDNLERALAAAEQTHSYEALVGGVALTLRQMQEYLKKNGVEAIEALGKEFDPNLHEAVMRVDDSEHPENTVVDEVQKGYMMHSRVLRPTMVKVARNS
ncbi:MAG: nucleotide exchange factor GrpE [Chthonomonadales bacterium]